MEPLSYEAIAPLIHQQSVQKHGLDVVFQCPVSGAQVSSRSTIQAGTGVGHTLARSASRNAMWTLRRFIFQSIRSMFGRNVIGRVVSETTNTLLNQASRDVNIVTPDQKRTAVVQAFRLVQRSFTWDTANKRWVSATLEGVQHPYDAQVAEAPVTTRYDRSILIRLLAELARADGTLSQSERDQLFDFSSADLDPIANVMQMPPVSPVELSETTEGPTRDTLLLLAWSMALTDEELVAAESERLRELAVGLGIPDARAAELCGLAQSYLLENMVAMAYSIGQRPESVREDAIKLGTKLGMDPAEAERTEIRYRKRTNL